MRNYYTEPLDRKCAPIALGLCLNILCKLRQPIRIPQARCCWLSIMCFTDVLLVSNKERDGSLVYIYVIYTFQKEKKKKIGNLSGNSMLLFVDTNGYGSWLHMM